MAKKKLSDILKEKNKEYGIDYSNEPIQWTDWKQVREQNKSNPISYIGKSFGTGAVSSVTDTITAPTQSYAVGLQRGKKQLEEEQSTWDHIKNLGKNLVKSQIAIEPLLAIPYYSIMGIDELKKDYLNTHLAGAETTYNNLLQQWNQTSQQIDSSNLDTKDIMNIYNYSNKTVAQGGTYLLSQVVQDSNPLLQSIYAGGQVQGQVWGKENAEKQIESLDKFDETIHKPTDKWTEELEEEGKNQSNFVKMLGEGSQTIGYMTPGILTSLASGGASASTQAGIQAGNLVQMGMAAKSNKTREAIKQGLDRETAETVGVGSGTKEAMTELMWSGVAHLGKIKSGGIEDSIKNWIGKTIDSNFTNKASQKIFKGVGNWLVDVTGESVEELVADIYDTWLDQATVDPNKQYTLNDALHTIIGTIISTTGMNGGYKAINLSQQALSNVFNRNQTRVENKESIPETERTESNNYKANIQEIINNVQLPEQMKQQYQQMLDSDATVNKEEYNNIKKSIKEQVKANAEAQSMSVMNTTAQQYEQLEQAKQGLDNIKPEDFKDAESRKFYAQQINKEFDSTIMDNILPMYPENRNGRRTVKQYKEIATQYGKAMAENGLSFDDVRANTVGAWQYYEPSKNITRYDNQQKQNQGFEKLNSQVWSQLVYDSYKSTMKTQIAEQQKNLQTNMESQVKAFKDEYDTIIDTIDNLGTQETQVTRTPEEVERTKKLVEDFAKNRGVKVEYNSDVFNNSNEEAFIKDNGKGDRTIYINPNADPDTILVKLATHEMFHDTIRTQPHDKLTKLVMDKLKADENYNTYRESVREAYQEQLEGKTQAEQDAIIDEEMTAKYLGEYLGDEQFVQQLVNSTNRSTIQKIMDWIDNRLQQIKNVVTGNKEAEYWRKVRENFEKAYNSKYQGQEGTQYSKDLNISDDGNARFSEDRLNYIIRGSVNDYSDNYARSYITKITPQQFLDLTTTPEGLQRLESESTELNPEQLKGEQQNIFLRVDMETGKVLGHEGRHRMIALRNAGINNVDIEIIPQQGTYDTENAKDFNYGLYLIGQSMNNGQKGKNVDFTNEITAVTKNNLDKIKQEYLNNNDNANDIRYSKKTAFDEALQQDTKGRELSKGQQEFFKDVPDILRDYDGNLRVYYRGSQDDFTVFDRKKASTMAGQGNGFYFTTSEEHAKQYGNAKEYYLNIKNPLIDTFRVQQEIDNGTYQKQISKEQLKKLVTEMSNNEDFDLGNYGYNSTVDSIVDDLWQKTTDYGMLEDLNATAYGNMAQFVDYVNDTLGTNFDGIVTDYETVVLKPEQIKRTDNLNPTDNPDIRYNKKTDFDKALQKDNQGRTLTKEQQEYFKDSKVRDENGNLIEVYHGTDYDFTVFKNPSREYNEYASGKMFADTSVSMFTDSQEVAQTYVDNEGNPNRKPMSVYLNMTNPYIVDADYQNNNYFFDKDGTPTNVNNLVKRIYGSGEYDGVIIKNVADVGNYYDYDLVDGRQYATDYIVFNSNQIKNVDNLKPTDNPDIRYSKKTKFDEALEEQREYNDIEDVPNFEKSLYNHRPQPRKGWDIDRIQKQLKSESSDRATTKELRKFDNVEDLMNNIFYHGSISSHDRLKAGSTLKEEQRTGGYGEAYHTISLSKSKNIASNFASMGSEGTVMPVLLKKDANVISMPQIEDSIELEDILPELWDKNVDAVKIGDWDIENKGYGEQEIVILNPNAIATMSYDTTYFKNFGKPKFENMTNKEVSDAFNRYVDRAIKDQEYHIEKLRNTDITNSALYKTQDQIDHAISIHEQQIEELKKLYNKFAEDADTKFSKKTEFDKALQKDNQGRTLTKEQQEYFKDSKVRDENGNLLEVYHSTPTYGFNIFDAEKLSRSPRLSQWGKGFYFTDNEMASADYKLSETGWSDNSGTYKTYLNITNPLILNNSIKTTHTLDRAKLTQLLLEGNNDYFFDSWIPFETAQKELNNDETFTKEQLQKMSREEKVEKYLQYNFDKGYTGDQNILKEMLRAYKTNTELIDNFSKIFNVDGIIVKGGRANQYIAFNPNQIKNVDNLNPTTNDDIRYNIKSKAYDDYLKANNPNRSGVTIGDLQQRLPTKTTQPILPTTKKTQTISSTIEEPTLKVPVPKGETGTEQKVAKVLSEPITKVKPEQRAWALFKANILDKGAVFEDLSFKSKNRELQAKWDSTLLADAKGQNAIGQARYEFENGEEKQVSKALTDIIDEVGENSEDFNNYMYHQLNIDRMTLEDRFDMANKPVFGDGIDANYSRQKVAELEKAHPEFKEYAQDVYDYLDTNKKELVDNGVISQETSDKFKEMYPHYVPIARIDSKGLAINVPLDTNRTGVNSPIKRAKGGSQDIQPLFQTMADRTMQTYKASSRNTFGLELKNTLDKLGMFNQLEATTENADNENLFEYDGEKGNLTEGTKYQNPTFTVFENGEKVTYEINQDMYDALRPKNEFLSKWDNTKLMKTTRKINDIRRGILTEYNPVFSITNAIKDAQDAFINSQHAAKTYAKYPEAYSQILKKGYWYKEYVQNGGSQNSYFTDGDFVKQDSKAKSIIKLPLEAISNVNNVIEMAPRLAEYIASREEGKSVQSSMLDASRVTTNFKAGGDITKFANRNGATFLNASVQGLQQNIRNIREANAKGLKGYGVLLGKAVIAGLPALLLNNLVWKDDDDYEDLQDYVKDNYYIIAKIGDHKFLRIPKGRTVAVIQKAVTNISDFLTNKDEIDSDKYSEVIWGDLKDTFELASSNLAPNNPIENNILSPIIQAKTNKTWYGEDLVPTRLQEKPNEEKYDESTAEISKQISGILNKIGLDTNPMQINYLLDQYGGGVSDILLPLGTPQAENNVIEDKFTTDSVMKSRYPGEFFELKDKLAVNRNSSKATDKDELLYKYANSVSGELSDLYKQKREIQNSSSTDKEKKQQISEVQKQINSKTQQALKDIKTPSIDGDTATIGDSEFIRTLDTNSGEYEWKKVTDKTKIQGVSLKTQADYQNRLNKYKQETGDSQLSDKEEIQVILDGNYTTQEKKNIYLSTTGKKDTLYNSVSNNLNIDEYLNYKTANIQGVKDSSGKTISGTYKQAQLDYINKNISGYENRLLLMGKDYKLSRTQQQDLAEYIYSQDNAEDLFKLFTKNFTVSNGTVYYK